jgi:hypothetical protein
MVELPSKTIIELLTYLIPGLIAAGTLYTLTPSPKPAPFERIVEALIFTVGIQFTVECIEWALGLIGRHAFILGQWSKTAGLGWSIFLALMLGLLLARWSNNDALFRFLRRTEFTRQTAYSSEWYGTFCKGDRYVVLHLVDGRRIYGWPDEWPNTPTAGQFALSLAEWLDDDKRIPLTGVEKVLIKATDVEMVEFMKPKEA